MLTTLPLPAPLAEASPFQLRRRRFGRPRWVATLVGLGVLLGPLAHLLIVAFIAVALMADGGAVEDEENVDRE